MEWIKTVILLFLQVSPEHGTDYECRYYDHACMPDLALCSRWELHAALVRDAKNEQDAYNALRYAFKDQSLTKPQKVEIYAIYEINWVDTDNDLR